MDYWQQIQMSFKNTSGGSPMVMAIVLLIAPVILVLISVVKYQLKVSKKNTSLRTGLKKEGLEEADLGIFYGAIDEICPGQPDKLLSDISLFHSWIDGLPNIHQASESLVTSLENIKTKVYKGHGGAYIPHSTRDLVPGTTVNLLRHNRGTELTACILQESTITGFALVTKGEKEIEVGPGEEVCIYYPRPEAMYQAICPVSGISPDKFTISLFHAVKGDFVVRQLREYWRVDVNIPLKFNLIEGYQEDGDETTKNLSARAINLSGNGAALITSASMIRGQIIIFNLPLSEKSVTNLQAEIIHISKTRNNDSRLHLVFRNLDPTEREKIIGSLFKWYRDSMLIKNDMNGPGF
jgi:c-di-GMP-binding flagellar brake protein YcgR